MTETVNDVVISIGGVEYAVPEPVADQLNALQCFSDMEGRVPRGWKLVPVNPTEEMLDAAREAMFVDLRRKDGLKTAKHGYYAAMQAAPKAPK